MGDILIFHITGSKEGWSLDQSGSNRPCETYNESRILLDVRRMPQPTLRKSTQSARPSEPSQASVLAVSQLPALLDHP